MKQCPACDRHLFGEEPSCPFCGAEQRSTAATSSGSRLAQATLVLGLGLAACGPQVLLPDDEGTTAADTGLTTTSPTTIGTTVAMTTVGPMSTDDGLATTSLETGASSSDSGDDFPCAFYACPPDVGNPFECDTFAQDCPPGEKCMPWSDDGGGGWNGTRCSPVAEDPAQDDEPCVVEGSSSSGIDDCDLGLMCFNADSETLQGTCVPLCEGTFDEPSCPSREQICSITNNDVLTLCLDACDPLAPGCPEGQGCYPVQDQFVCAITYTESVYGDPCDFINGCSPGQTCLGSAAFPECLNGGCCSVYCDVTAPETCPEAMLDATCQPFYEPGTAPPGLEDVGVCSLPV